ncbi:hypothetical protein niasHS_016177 [Heterodera schachtii]|uniref:Serpin domain-containing protein n=1 Tax=Heterodera schachtii TaxID=97005 RepID=A0ABD2HS07_HETSC
MSSPPSPNVACILEAQADFALKFLREVSTDDRSCIVSPFFVAVTLSMVYAGAKEKTGEEMGQLLAKGVASRRRDRSKCTKLKVIQHLPCGVCKRKEFLSAHEAQHPETAIPPALVEGAMVIPYKPGVAIFMEFRAGSDTLSPFVMGVNSRELGPRRTFIRCWPIEPLTQQAISGAAFQARTFCATTTGHSDILDTHPILVSRTPHGFTEGPSVSAGAFAAFFR